MWYLYKITCKISGEYYFGITNDTEARFRKHIKYIYNLLAGINLHHPYQKVHYSIAQTLRKRNVDCNVIKDYIICELLSKSATKYSILVREQSAIDKNRNKKKCLNLM